MTSRQLPTARSEPSAIRVQVCDGYGQHTDHPSTTTTKTVTTTTTTSSGGSGGDDDGCDGFWGCVGHYLEKAAPVIVVVVVVVVVVVAASACTAESGGLLGPACVEGAGAAFTATCGAMLGDCGPGPGGESASETAWEDAGAASKGAKPSGEAGPTGPKGAASAGSATKEASENAAGANAAAPKKASAQDAAEASSGAAAHADEPSTGNSGTTCSFSPETPVLMEDGTGKPIGEVTAGDKVEAADPDNGKDEGSRTVVATWAHDDNDLIDLTVEVSPGDAETLHTTSEHPFWDATTRTWVPAAGLTPGHALTTPDGHAVHVLRVQPTPGTATRYNLTVDRLHTFYVLAGATPVLVHNRCGSANEPTRPAYVWRGDRHPEIDDGAQGPLADHQIVRSGQGIEAGTYIFVQKRNGATLAMNESLYEEGAFHPDADWPGHTSLADHEPVLFAGGFTVDARGRVLEMTNGSGHYQPGSYAPSYNEADYMPLRDVAARALQGFGLTVDENTQWKPWPVRN
ncbi:polymorphic toxin-type HINT domain-containing protein [Streptomyces sp. NY05-11A]|uniref:polymorphic toxin-type HINT domain-containing protein n=1 Tax=Streptomyces soliscabiei TaxID=588897 RepID=UPI0029B284A0|nr:polymorphic toxin-type HINT domain-containing protein [Streptomyces sp. NY05-11A]MDX2675924.1 polymorphic toxin-type HINT domain-containing protein [Streptomyces sp. NY05-11A]